MQNKCVIKVVKRKFSTLKPYPVLEIKFQKADFVPFLLLFANSLKCSIKNKTIQIPLGSGSGWMWAENLPSGISVLAYDIKLNRELTIIREPNSEEFYSLQFEEIFIDKMNPNGSKSEISTKSTVKISQSIKAEKNYLPANVRVKGFRFSFNKQQISQFIDSYSIEKIFNQHLLSELHKETYEIIDLSYRLTLDEIAVPTIEQPLQYNYIQNRVLLLLETFIKKTKTAKVIPIKAKVNDSDLERLIVAESLLVKDYKTPPPTIDNLSKICAMSATKLKNDFKSLYGLPIYEYYQKNRMSKAKALLMEGLYTCKEVGLQIGYSNLSHFASAFKKEFGISPSDLLTKRSKLMYAV